MNESTLFIVTNNGILIGIYTEANQAWACMQSLDNPFVDEFGSAPFGEF